MWRMLIAFQRDKPFKVHFNNVQHDGNIDQAHQEVKYVFTKTGPQVHNSIDVEFIFKDGLIFHHKDKFNLHNWAKQAIMERLYLRMDTPIQKQAVRKNQLYAL